MKECRIVFTRLYSILWLYILPFLFLFLKFRLYINIYTFHTFHTLKYKSIIKENSLLKDFQKQAMYDYF